MPKPNFIIIGAQKCGTTSLYNYLTRHPQILPATRKEVHFFDLRFDKKRINWYYNQFPQTETPNQTITGEASPYYIFHPLVPQRISQYIPDIKLIVLLRNPVDRAASHYYHNCRFGKSREPLSFEEAIQQESSRIEPEIDKIMADENYKSLAHQYYSYLSRGIYIEQLSRWMQFFPRKSFLILNSEEFWKNPKRNMKQVWNFLGVPSKSLKNYQKYNSTGSIRQKNDDINPATRMMLTEYFQPYNQRLEEYLGMKFNWDNTPVEKLESQENEPLNTASITKEVSHKNQDKLSVTKIQQVEIPPSQNKNQKASRKVDFKYLVVATARSGTTFMARALRSVGINCGHEIFFGAPSEQQGNLTEEVVKQRMLNNPDIEADSSWLAVPFLNTECVPKDVSIIHLTRHPKKVIESLIAIGLFRRKHNFYTNYALLNTPEIKLSDSELTKCCKWYLYWNRKIEESCRQLIHYRVEDPVELLLDRLNLDYDSYEIFNNTKTNTRNSKKRREINLIEEIEEPDLLKQIMEMAERYSYSITEETEIPESTKKNQQENIVKLDKYEKKLQGFDSKLAQIKDELQCFSLSIPQSSSKVQKTENNRIFKIQNAIVKPILKFEPRNWVGGVVFPKDMPGIFRHRRPKIQKDMKYQDVFIQVDDYINNFNNCKFYPGTYIYGGSVSPHFGHALTEGIHRLWAFNSNIHDGIVFAVSGKNINYTPKKWFIQTLEILEIPLAKCIWVTNDCAFENLIVPEPGSEFTLGAKNWYRSYLEKLQQKIFDATHDLRKEKGEIKLFLGRSHIPLSEHIGGEKYWESLLVDEGYISLKPENYSMLEQVAYLMSAKKIIFSEGSAIYSLELLNYLDADITCISRRANNQFYYPHIDSKCRNYIATGNAENILRLGNGIKKSTRKMPINKHPYQVVESLRNYDFALLKNWDEEKFFAQEKSDVMAYIEQVKAQFKNLKSVKSLEVLEEYLLVRKNQQKENSNSENSNQNQKQLTETTPQAQVEIVDITLSKVDSQHLWGCHIDRPKKGEKIDSGNNKMEIMGWVLGKSSRVVAVEIISDGNILQTVPIDKQRLGVAKAFPYVKEAKNSGFATKVRFPKEVSESELFLEARLEDESLISLGKIKIRSVPSKSIKEVDWDTSDRTLLTLPQETIQQAKVEVQDVGLSKLNSKNYCSPNLVADSKVEIISVHLPKTAGTTFRQILEGVYTPEKVCSDYTGSKFSEELLTKIGSPDIKVIHGHFPVTKYQDMFLEAKRIIWLREPIRRLLSHYIFVINVQKKRRFTTVKKEKNKLLEFAQTNSMKNLMSSYVKDLQYFWFVGIQDFFQEDLIELQEKLGWSNIKYFYANKNPSKIHQNFVKEVLLDAEMIEQLKAINSEDIEVYETALKMREERRKYLLKNLPSKTIPKAKIINISLSKVDSQHLWGCHIDRPKKGEKIDSGNNKIEIMGWVLGKSSRAVAVEIISQGSIIQTVPIDKKRPGVAKAFPHVKKAKNSGFVATVGLLGLSMASELIFQAILANGIRIPVGTLAFRPLQPLMSGYKPKLQPLAISSVGPSGAEKLLKLLMGHPSLAGMGNYPDQIPPGQYWLQWLKAFSLEENSDLEELASFCQQTIDGFYSRVNGSEISYFIERYDASRPELLNLLSELYPEGKEIILVRDFRDLVYSMLPFSGRKYEGFELKTFKSYQQFVYEFGKYSVGGLLQRWQERSSHIHLVKYEDLILSPRETLSGILKYLGLDNSQEKLDIILGENYQEQFKSEPPVGDWQYEMVASLQVLSTEVCEAALQEFGYI